MREAQVSPFNWCVLKQISCVQSSLEKALASQLRSAMAKPIQDNFRSSFQQQLLPAFENACQAMFSQVLAFAYCNFLKLSNILLESATFSLAQLLLEV